MCDGWLISKKNLHRRKPANLTEWGELPLWSPHLAHISPNQASCKTRAERLLREHGAHRVNDIATADGTHIAWHDSTFVNLPVSNKKAYKQLHCNIAPTPTIVAERSKVPIFLEGQGKVWEYGISRDRVSTWSTVIRTATPTRTYSIASNVLALIDSNRVPAQTSCIAS
jgi:hypothetical protein